VQAANALRALALGMLLLASRAHGEVLIPVAVQVTELIQLDNVDPLPLNLGDLFAEVTINGETFSNRDDQCRNEGLDGFIIPFPFFTEDGFVDDSCRNVPWTFHAEIPLSEILADPEGIPITIRILDEDTFFDDELEVVDLRVPFGGRWTGRVDYPEHCVNEGLDGGAGLCWRIDVANDSDGDGLTDRWEQEGVDTDADGTIDIDLPGIGVNPLRKDQLVELDCLVDDVNGNGVLEAQDHTHCPRQDGLADVVRSFTAAPILNLDGTTGVQLHVDVGDLYGANANVAVAGRFGAIGSYGNYGGGGSRIPEAGNTRLNFTEAPGHAITNFFTLKAAHFDARRERIFRYGLFAHQVTARALQNDCTSGWAPSIPAADFIVSLGGTGAAGLPCWTTDGNGFSVGSRLEQGGTFMHELGHDLGLHHGGADDLPNDKPNYLSVMNYSFQMCSVPASPNGQLHGGCDYSPVGTPDPLPALREPSLDECLGIGGGLGFGAVNWDGDALLEGTTCPAPNTQNVSADINFDNLLSDLVGHDDWQAVVYPVRTAEEYASAGGTPVENEVDPSVLEQSRRRMAEQMAPGVVVEKSGPAAALPGELVNYSVTVRNGGSGPALNVALADVAPDGATELVDLGAVVVAGEASHDSSFRVPADACPGDFTGASASVTFADFVGNALSASGSAPLEIRDVVPPQLSVSASPSQLWPPNHKFVPITVTVSVGDECDGTPHVRLVSIASNEGAGAPGSGNTSPDVRGADFGTDDRSFQLRAERSGSGSGRVYTITYEAEDASGNVTTRTATVGVAKSQGNS
jgi:uncharacterized repeat protein (TIGR01451 family)